MMIKDMKTCKEGIGIGVHSHIVQIVVFAAGADTFLGIRGTHCGIGASPLTKEDGDKLVHACVGKEKVRGVWHEARRGNNDVGF